MINLFVCSGIFFVDCSEVLIYIGNEMFVKGVVYDIWLQVLIVREVEFFIGIMFEQYVIVILYCEVIYVKLLVIYLLRLINKVYFQ